MHAVLRVMAPVVLLVTMVACNRSPEAPPAEPAGPATPSVDAPLPPGDPVPVDPAAPAPATSAPPTAAAPVVARPAPAPSAPAAPVANPAPATSAPALAAPASDIAAEPAPPPARLVTIPANTDLRLTLQSDVASDTSKVEDRVTARVAANVNVGGETVIPEGSRVTGVVTYATPSAKVKGRAAVTVRFRTLTIGSQSYDITAEPLRREAAGTKAKDARDIGIGAGAGAIVGGIIGGRKGAGIGAAVGGAGGTGVVLATRGDEVRLPSGTSITTRLEAPVTVEVMRH